MAASCSWRSRWEPVAFDDQALVAPEATEIDVGGRRGRFATREGDVIAVGEGQVQRDIYSDLVLDLDQGPLGLHLVDTKGRDSAGDADGAGRACRGQGGRPRRAAALGRDARSGSAADHRRPAHARRTDPVPRAGAVLAV